MNDTLCGIVLKLPKQPLHIQPLRKHRQLPIGSAGPLFLRAIPVEFDAVLIRITQIECFADAMIGGTIERDVGMLQTPEGIGEAGTGGVEDGQVIEAGGAGGRRRAAEAFPGVEANVVMVATCGDERGTVAEALHQLEAQHTAVEAKGAFQVGDLEMDMADADIGVNGEWVHQCYFC